VLAYCLINCLQCYMCVCCVAVASDSDDNDVLAHTVKPSTDVNTASSFPSKLHGAHIVKYNFLDLSKCVAFDLA